MNTEKKFILFILIISLTYFICEKQNNIVEGLTNHQCTMLGKIPVLGGFLKSFLCPIKSCNANDNNQTTQECLCNEITVQPGKYCYTDKGKTDVRDVVRDPCEEMDCGVNSKGCQNGICECKDGFEGEKCENEKERCSDEICNNGTVEPGFVSDGCKCKCSNGWENEEGWEQDQSKICSKRVRSSLKNSPCITNGLCSKVGPDDSDYICNVGYYLNNKDCEKCPDKSTNQSKENISTIGSLTINDCVCDNPGDYMGTDNEGKSICIKCPGIGKIRGIKNTGDPSEDCICDKENGYLDKGDGSCVKCPGSAQIKISGSQHDAFKWDPVKGFCGCDTPNYVPFTKDGVNTCISNPACMINPELGPTSNKDLPFDKSNKCNGETVKKQLKELAEKDSSIEILRDDEMLEKYMKTIKCDHTKSSCICPDGVSDKGDGLFNEKCHGCKDGKVLKYSKSHDGTREIDNFSCVINPCIYSKGGEELKKVSGLGCFDSFDFGQTAGSRQIDKFDSKSVISIDDNDNFVFYNLKGEKSTDLSKLSEVCPSGNKCGAELLKGVGESEEPWKKENPCWPLNEQKDGAKQWWKFVDGKCVCTVPKKYRLKDNDGYPKCIPSTCWDFSDPKKPKSVCKVNNDPNKPSKEIQQMNGDPPGCITTAVGPECQCKRGFYHSEPTQEEPIAQCTVKTMCENNAEENSPEEGEKYKDGHWRKEELYAWLKAPGGTGIMQNKDPATGKARVIKEDSVLDINKEDSVALSDWPKDNNINVNFVVAWSPKRTKLPSPTQTNASGATNQYGQNANDTTHPNDHHPNFNLPNEISDADYVKKTNEEIFYTPEMDKLYKTSYLDHKGNWIHKCDCSAGGEIGLNPLTNCKCKFNEYLDLETNACVSFEEAGLMGKINCSERGNNSNWNKANVGDFYNLYNPKCIMKGKGGYISEKGNDLKEKCCLSCASKFYEDSALKDKKLFASPPASGFIGRDKAWNNAYCKNKSKGGDKWGKKNQTTINCPMNKDLDINDFPTQIEALLPTSNTSHYYADNGQNKGSVPPYMRQMMALGTNTRPPVWATGKDLDTTTDTDRNLTYRTTKDHYGTLYKIPLSESSYSDSTIAARNAKDYSEMFKENVFYCKRTNKTQDGKWGDEPVQIHNSYWDKGDRQSSAATASGQSKIAGGTVDPTTHDGSRNDDLYRNDFYSFDPEYKPEFTYPVRGGSGIGQWTSGVNTWAEFSRQPNDHDGPNNMLTVKDANGKIIGNQQQHPLMAPLHGSNIGVKRYAYMPHLKNIATGTGFSPNFAGRQMYYKWAMPWLESDPEVGAKATAAHKKLTGSQEKGDQAFKYMGTRATDDMGSRPTNVNTKFMNRRNPNADPIVPKQGETGWVNTKVANRTTQSPTCAFSHDGCQGFWDQGKKAHHHSGIFQAGSPDDKNIGAPSGPVGSAQLKGVWVKRHDTYQKNCATISVPGNPAKQPGGQNGSANASRNERIANYDKANIGMGGYRTNDNFSRKTYKGTHELRAECLGKPQHSPGGSPCPASVGNWHGDLCRDDDVLYGAETRAHTGEGSVNGYHQGLGQIPARNAINFQTWQDGRHQNWDWGLAEDIWSNKHYPRNWGNDKGAFIGGLYGSGHNPKYNASKAFRYAENARGSRNDLPATGRVCIGDDALYGVGGSAKIKGVGGTWPGRVCMDMLKSNGKKWRTWINGTASVHSKKRCSAWINHHCPHAWEAVYQQVKKKGNSDMYSKTAADRWCNVIPGCKMHTPSPRGISFDKIGLDGSKAAKHLSRGAPLYSRSAPPLHHTIANKTVYSNNYKTEKHGGHGAIHKPGKVPLHFGASASYGSLMPGRSRPSDNAFNSKGKTRFTRDWWDLTAHGGATTSTAVGSRKHQGHTSSGLRKSAHRKFTEFHERADMWACKPGKGCTGKVRPISTQGVSMHPYFQKDLVDTKKQELPEWGNNKTVPESRSVYKWHKGTNFGPGGQRQAKRKFDTWRRSIRSFSRSPYDCPISPYVYDNPQVQRRAMGAAKYIKPTAATSAYPYGPNMYYGADLGIWTSESKSPLGTRLKEDIRASFTPEPGQGTGQVPKEKWHAVTHINQAEYKQSGYLDTGMPNGNCYLRGEGAYGDAGREGMGLCRRMTKDGPVKMSCCDSNFTSGSSGAGRGTHNDLFEYGNMNCQVSPFYRTNPDPTYYKKGMLYDSDSSKSAIISSSGITSAKNISFPDPDVHPNDRGAGKTKPWNK